MPKRGRISSRNFVWIWYRIGCCYIEIYKKSIINAKKSKEIISSLNGYYVQPKDVKTKILDSKELAYKYKFLFS